MCVLVASATCALLVLLLLLHAPCALLAAVFTLLPRLRLRLRLRL
jgi:hypothetical protein